MLPQARLAKRPSARKQRQDIANEDEDRSSASDVGTDAPLTDRAL